MAQDVSPSARKHSSASAASVGSLASVDTAGGTADGGPQIVRRELEVGGLFFAIGHRPATDFLNGQVGLGRVLVFACNPLLIMYQSNTKAVAL